MDLTPLEKMVKAKIENGDTSWCDHATTHIDIDIRACACAKTERRDGESV
jgi:hypothetical protein